MRLLCLIATEPGIAGVIKGNLLKLSGFSDWTFETCSDASDLEGWSGKNIEVLVLSRFLLGADAFKLLHKIPMLFPSAHIVLLAGQLTESTRAYIRAADKAGLRNVVTGKLPGERPYNLMTALKRPKQPELDGYIGLGDDEQEQEPEHDRGQVQDVQHSEAPQIPPAAPRRELPSSRRQSGKAAGVLVVATANKGGVGKTTVAIHTAAALGRAGIPTALVDLDLGGPNLSAYFKIQGVPGIERLSNLSSINPAQIDRLLVEVERNLYVLPGPTKKAQPIFKGEELLMVLDYLRQKYPVVVCDTPQQPWTKRWLYDAFEAVDMALAVVDQSLFSEEETKRYAPTLLAMGVRPENIRIVLNRYCSELHSPRLVEKMFCSGFKKDFPADKLPRILTVIPAGWVASVKDTYSGKIADLEAADSPWHKVAKEIAGLAGYRYEPSGKDGGGAGKMSLFGKLFGKGER